MSHKLTALILTFGLAFTCLTAKSNLTIYGKVIEKENGKPLPYATISIHTKDNSIIGGTITSEDGTFKLINSSLSYEDCKVKVSFIGFRDTLVPVPGLGDDINMDLGIIALSADAVTLASAVVTARVPVIEHKLDKIIMNVAEAVSTQGSNALDILKKAPGVSVDPSGNILLNGSSVQVWIDGRPSNISGADLEALLSSTDGSTIDKIEIIAHPSSKYDAAGSGGIINIRTKKNFAQGLNGSSRLSYNVAKLDDRYYHGADASFVINYRTEKNNTSFTYSPRYNEVFNTFNTTTELKNGNTILSNTLLNRDARINGFRLSNDYFANKKSIFGFVINGMLRNYQEATGDDTGSQLFYNGNRTGSIKTIMDNEYNFDNFSVNLNYTHMFKDNHEITMNADYYYFDMERINWQENQYLLTDGTPTGSGIFRSNSNQYINIKSLKADYEQIIKKDIKLEAGAKWAQSTTDNNLLREDKINSNWVPNNQISTKFYYTEDIMATYVTAAKNFGEKVTLKGGLRAELTVANGEWFTADTITKSDYVDIFPTLFIGYNPNKKLKFSASYTKRIQRPNFEQLNPQRFYIDATSSAQGNPSITPQYSHQISLSMGISRHLNFAINGQFFDNVIVQTPSFEAVSGEKLLTWDNFGTMSMVGFNVSITEFPVTKWFIFNGNFNVSNLDSKYGDFTTHRVFTNANINSTFLIPGDIKIELSGWYRSGIPYGYFDIKPQSDLTLGFRKGLFKNKGTLSLMLNDVLNTNNTRISLEDNVFDNYKFESHYKSRRFTVTFNYRFGQSKAVKQRKVGNVDEASRVNAGN